jgi:hypothetical protein
MKSLCYYLLFLIPFISISSKAEVAKDRDPQKTGRYSSENVHYFFSVIRGKVVDAQGNPLSNAAITIVGQQTGTFSNYTGDYNIAAPVGSVTLRYTYTGCASKDIVVNVPVDNVIVTQNAILECELLTNNLFDKKQEINGDSTLEREDFRWATLIN